METALKSGERRGGLGGGIASVWRHVSTSSLAASVGVYGAGNVLNSAVPFLLMPLLTRTLTQEDYGLVNLFTIALVAISPLTALGVAGFINVARFRQSDSGYRRITELVPAVILAATAAVVLATWLFRGAIAHWVPLPGFWLLLVPITAGTRNLGEALLSHFQANRKPVRFISFQLAQTLLNLALTLLLVFSWGMAWRGRSAAQALAAAVGAVVAVAVLRPWRLFSSGIQKDEIARALRFGGPLIPQQLAANALSISDRYLVIHFAGLAAAGVYGVGYQLGQILNIVDLSLNKAWVPWMFEKLSANAPRSRIWLSIVIYAGILLGLTGVITLGAHLAAHFLLGPRFSDALPFVLWIALAFAMNGIAGLFSAFFQYYETTKWLWLGTLGTVLAHVAIVVVTVPRYGAIAAAMSAAVTAFGRALAYGAFGIPFVRRRLAEAPV